MHTRTRRSIAIITHRKDYTKKNRIGNELSKECRHRANMAQRLGIKPKPRATSRHGRRESDNGISIDAVRQPRSSEPTKQLSDYIVTAPSSRKTTEDPKCDRDAWVKMRTGHTTSKVDADHRSKAPGPVF